jgi:UDP-N-acetyl-D-mannosaminuronate dehydrogenase
MILAGRRINDNIGYFIAEKTISELTKQGIGLVGAKIAILGLTFKENCPDLRNTKVITIIEQLREYQCQITVSDCWANGDEVKKSFNFELTELNDIKDQDSVIIAVGHDEHTHFKSADWSRMLRSNGVLIDVKSIYNHEVFKGKNIKYWRL